MKDDRKYAVLLYYCYAKIEDPEQFRIDHNILCVDLDLRGRIIVAHEGLNGTVSGTVENCEKYMAAVHADPRFSHTDFKVDYTEHMAFQKIQVRVKPEIVHSSLKHIDPTVRTGIHLEPE